MAFDRAKTSLQAVEEKLRRLFNLAGTIGASFEPAITPVVVVSNLDDPGVGSFRGRHFAWVSEEFTAPGPANAVIGLRFGTEAIITRLLFTGGKVPTRCAAYLFPPELEASAPAATLATPTGTWTDQRQKTVDNPPLLGTVAGIPVAGAVVNFTQANRIAAWHYESGGGTGSPVLDCGTIHVPGGSAVYFDAGASILNTSLCRFGVYGRIF